jgi:hypothetical protein
MIAPRRFPPPWSVEELDACFVVRDNSGQKLSYVYFEDEPGRRTWDKARRERNLGLSAVTARNKMQSVAFLLSDGDAPAAPSPKCSPFQSPVSLRYTGLFAIKIGLSGAVFYAHQPHTGRME